MPEEEQNEVRKPSRLLPCFLNAADDGLMSNAIMLCEVIGEEIQSISHRVAADAIARWQEGNTVLRPEQS